MKVENPLDKHLAVNKAMPGHLHSAICDVADTLDLAWLATQSVFEDKATPELAIAVFDRLVSRLQVQWSLKDSPQKHE
jgi:hypothetical protein